MVHTAFFPSTVAVIFTVPDFMPVTFPFFTLAILLLLLRQVTFFEVPDTVAFNVKLDPAVTEAFVLLKVIFTFFPFKITGELKSP